MLAALIFGVEHMHASQERVITRYTLLATERDPIVNGNMYSAFRYNIWRVFDTLKDSGLSDEEQEKFFEKVFARDKEVQAKS